MQLATGGHKAYLTAVDRAFGHGIEYAVLAKLYGDSSERQNAAARLSASVVKSASLKDDLVPRT